MNYDSQLIFEKYQTRVSEGILDRLKAKGAGAVGTVKGAGKRMAGAAKGAVAGLSGDVEGVKAASLQRKAGAAQGQLAKIESYRKTANTKVKKLAEEIFKDLNGLGIDLKRVSPNSVNTFATQLDRAFVNLIEQVKVDAGISASQQTTLKGSTAASPQQAPVQNKSQAAQNPANQPAS